MSAVYDVYGDWYRVLFCRLDDGICGTLLGMDRWSGLFSSLTLFF